ncbi:MAG TPA: Bro-N domain-containing protein, partial [Saprospiraceae bacterium]|nr:Bro-N domain-containing protein [Saprospiraceae bacterium]
MKDEHGEAWFVAADVAKVLGYRNAPDMTRNIDDEDKGTQIVRTLGGTQEITIINESGLYTAIIYSRRPEAKAFRRKVTSEILPSIR